MLQLSRQALAQQPDAIGAPKQLAGFVYHECWDAEDVPLFSLSDRRHGAAFPVRRPTIHSIPASARTNTAIGVRQIGRFSERKNVRGSSVGISAIIKSTTKMTTPDIDQGNNIAINTASKSTLRIRAAGSCYAAKTIDALAIQDALLSVTSLPAMTEDAKEGLKVFGEKRKPSWRGR